MRRFTAIAGALLVLAGCTESDTTIVGPEGARGANPMPASGDAAKNVTSETSSDLWARIITGETGPGSMYQLYLPRNWNGTAVFYAHGIRDVLEPVSLRDQDASQAVRDQLGALGYAVAQSSFSENGYAVEDAVQRTHQLRGLFASQFGQPTRSLLLGHSLGALAVMELSQRFPSQYDGVVPVCGIMGGTTAQLEYVVNVRALFDHFYPGLLPGTADAPVPGYVMDAAKQQQIIAAVSANPVGMLVIASTAQTPLEFTTSAQLVESLLNALAYHARGADNVLAFTNGEFPVSNVGVTYSPRPGLIVPPLTLPVVTGLLAIANNQVPEFEADPSAAIWAEQNFTPSGELQIPTITLHNRWDRLVPFFHETMLAARVADAGATNLLVQRSNPAWGYGHCAIPTTALVQAITDLNAWVETTIKPNN
jgi:pimeloyl-ACP methyl ester carboxylesterase